MIDIQILRDNPDKVSEAAKQKGFKVDISGLLKLDEERKILLNKVETLRQKRNINAHSAKNKKPVQSLITEGKKLKSELTGLEEQLKEVEAKWLNLLKQVPNLPTKDVPVGDSEKQNAVVKEWGKKPEFDFEPKNHWELAENRDLIDKERASKVTGSRFAYIKGGLVHLQFAIIQFVLDTLTNQEVIAKIINDNELNIKPNVFIPILPPVMIREDMYDQMDRLEPREDRYHIDGEDDNLWLIGSAEHTLGSMHAGEIFTEDSLPLRYIGYSTSFRQEAGTYGKDTEGIIRMHQFDKLEMEVFSTAKTSLHEHLLMIAIQEYLMQQLEIPYHILMKCTADIGKPNARGVDVEAWMPGQNRYRETHTADYMTDYQTRRLQTRVKLNDGTVELTHTNDATAFALGRTMVAIIENNQQNNGQIIIPTVLRTYMGGKETI